MAAHSMLRMVFRCRVVVIPWLGVHTGAPLGCPWVVALLSMMTSFVVSC